MYLHDRRIFHHLGRHHGHPRGDRRHPGPDRDGRGRVLLEFCKQKGTRLILNNDLLIKCFNEFLTDQIVSLLFLICVQGLN